MGKGDTEHYKEINEEGLFVIQTIFNLRDNALGSFCLSINTLMAGLLMLVISLT